LNFWQSSPILLPNWHHSINAGFIISTFSFSICPQWPTAIFWRAKCAGLQAGFGLSRINALFNRHCGDDAALLNHYRLQPIVIQLFLFIISIQNGSPVLNHWHPKPADFNDL